MVTNYASHFSTRTTHQTDPIPGTAQVQNSAGGYSFAVDDWTKLDRFLVLGTEGGSYYASEHKLTVENAKSVMECIDLDGIRTVNRILEISETGRAPKNDAALFALAMAMSTGNDKTKALAADSLPRVARIGTHMFHFLEYAQAFRGWGRVLHNAVANWYTSMPADKLAYQAIKYQQRDGWTHRDALRLSHPKPPTDAHNAIFNWMAHGWPDVGNEPHPDKALVQIWAHEQAQKTDDIRVIKNLIEYYHLPWESIPTKFLAEKETWKSLLPTLAPTALMRNLARMTANETLAPLSKELAVAVANLTDKDAITKARVHPIAALSALKTYAQGHGERGNLHWNPISQITDALDQMFYASFGNVTPTGKRIVLALDVSGSMEQGNIAGAPGITPRVGSGAMALVTAAVESQYAIVGFTGGGNRQGGGPSMNTVITPLDISPRMRLDQVIQNISGLPFGGTDCALPMLWALERGLDVDAFVIYTDSETWAGRIHPTQALKQYRERTGIPAKLVVVGMVANEFSIADPNDSGMMDVIGFDTATPNLISDFIAQ